MPRIEDVPFLLRFRTSLPRLVAVDRPGQPVATLPLDQTMTGNRTTEKTAVDTETTDED